MSLESMSLSDFGSIRGVDHLDGDRLAQELEQGARFVTFRWCVSLVLVTFQRPTGVLYIAPGKSRLEAGLPYLMTSLLLGWWGLPWGPFHTIGCVWLALRGGQDCTRQIVEDLELIFPEGFATPEQKARILSIVEAR